MDAETGKRGSLRRKINISAHLTVIVILVVTFISYYYIFRNEFQANIQRRLISLTQTAALLIDSDEHERLKTRADEESQEYLRIKKVLQDIKQANPDIRYIYTMRKTGQKNIWEFVVDAEDKESEEMSHIGDSYDVSAMEEMKKAFACSITDKHFETDQWGTFLSGYAPIKDKSGRAVAIVGMDIVADTLVKQERKMLLGALVIFLTSMGLITFTTRRTVNSILGPVNRIMEGITQIRNNNLDYRVEIKTNDEFAEIGVMLNSTAGLMVDYRRLLERELEIAREQKEKIFLVYRNVIFSITQGKFVLLNYGESILIAEEGRLFDELKLEKPEDVGAARQLMTQFLEAKDFPPEKIGHISLCLSEAATNVIKHAREGIVRVKILADLIRVTVSDKGPGMEFSKLPNMIFLEGFSTKISMGYGFSIIYKYADKIYLSTSNTGTFLAMDFQEKIK